MLLIVRFSEGGGAGGGGGGLPTTATHLTPHPNIIDRPEGLRLCRPKWQQHWGEGGREGWRLPRQVKPRPGRCRVVQGPCGFPWGWSGCSGFGSRHLRGGGGLRERGNDTSKSTGRRKQRPDATCEGKNG